MWVTTGCCCTSICRSADGKQSHSRTNWTKESQSTPTHSDVSTTPWIKVYLVESRLIGPAVDLRCSVVQIQFQTNESKKHSDIFFCQVYTSERWPRGSKRNISDYGKVVTALPVCNQGTLRLHTSFPDFSVIAGFPGVFMGNLWVLRALTWTTPDFPQFIAIQVGRCMTYACKTTRRPFVPTDSSASFPVSVVG